MDNVDPLGNQIDDAIDLCQFVGGLAGFSAPVTTQAATAVRAGTIWINIGFDDSVNINAVKPKMDRSYDFLDHLLTQNCPQWGITWLGYIKKQYDWKRKPAPKGGDYTSSILDNSHGFGISGHPGGIPVLLTTHSILGGSARAVTVKGQVIVYNVKDSNNSTLAHETGHWAGYYNAADPDHSHSLDPINIMFTGGGDDRTYADDDYCTKVTALAQ